VIETAYAVGYIMTPLRGSIRMRLQRIAVKLAEIRAAIR